jgi:hypothetical protein
MSNANDTGTKKNNYQINNILKRKNGECAAFKKNSV